MRGLLVRLAAGILVVSAGAAAAASEDPSDPSDLAGAPPVDDTPTIVLGSGPVGSAPADWIVSVAGWTATFVDETGPSGGRAVRLEPAGNATGRFGNLMRTIEAGPLAGQRVEVTANLRTAGVGQAQMWVRADRPDGGMGAFDNMGDRPVRGRDWQVARIVVDIDEDAKFVNVGVLAIGGATVEIDDLRLLPLGVRRGSQVADEPRPLTERGLDNVAAAARLVSYLRFFHPSDQCVGVASWDHVAVAVVEAAEPATDAEDLAERLRAAIGEIAPTVTLWAGAPDNPPDRAVVEPPPVDVAPELRVWRHRGAGSASSAPENPIYVSRVESHSRAAPPDLDLSPVVVDLGGGVSMRMPLAVPADRKGTLPHGKTPPRWRDIDDLPRLTTDNRSTRLAAVALGWGVFRHFYPYFDVIEERFEVDWNSALADALRGAAKADGAKAHLDVLRRLVARLHDGHGRVFSPRVGPTSFLPVAVEFAGDDLVVVARRPEAEGRLHVGDAIVAIDGRPIEAVTDELGATISWGTVGWRRWRLAEAIVTELATGDPATLTVRAPDGEERTVQLARSAAAPPIGVRTTRGPANGTPVGDPADGIVYLDLRGLTVEEFIEHIGTLARAKAIVFDLRGYPDSAAVRLLGHLIAEPVQSARWMTPLVHRPDGEAWSWDESGRWRLAPTAPRLDQPSAFLTDGSAISYAESILGIVEHYGLGEIVGSPTAGANGNVNPIALPGGDQVMWTGMKVLKHDGSRHHALGILPTVPVEPTQRGIAEGRDEVLEKAVEVLKARLAEVADAQR